MTIFPATMTTQCDMYHELRQPVQVANTHTY